MARAQRRNAISPASSEAIILRTFSFINSSENHQTHHHRNPLSIPGHNPVERQLLHVDVILNRDKNSCAAPAA